LKIDDKKERERERERESIYKYNPIIIFMNFHEAFYLSNSPDPPSLLYNYKERA
jgi:hypothetical protein